MNDRPAVLIVDDRRENLFALEQVLAPLDCRLVQATSGDEALKRLLHEDFAAILLDVQMPDMDGFETAEIIKRRRRTRLIPIIFVTAISKEEQHVFRGYEAGAVDYVFKPYDPHVLRSKVAVFLDLYVKTRALARSEAALRATFEWAPIGMARLDDHDRIVDANRALAYTLGRTEESLAGRSLASLVHSEDLAVDQERREALRDGRLASYEVELRLLHEDGTSVDCQASFSAVHDENGTPDVLLMQIQDIRERKRAAAERETLLREQTARREAERLSTRLAAVQRITDATLGALQLEPLLDVLLRRLTETLSVDTAAAVLRDTSSVHARAMLYQVADTLGATETAAAEVCEDGILARLEAAGGPLALRDASETEHPLGETVSSLLAVPLGDGLGALLVGSLFPRQFTDEDEALLALAADRAALAIERARVYEQQHTIAEELQRSLLPDSLPDVASLALCARYSPGGAGTAVGGDWYDAVPLPGGRLLLVMGDVAGRGVRAAATMGQLRSAVRAYAFDAVDPADLAVRLNRFFLAMQSDTMATGVLAVIDPSFGTLRYVNAGHPPPLIAGPDGTTRLLRRARGVPFGALDDPEYENEEVALEEGSILVLYTDGLVERRGEDPDVGLRRLEQAVAGGGSDVNDLCDVVWQRVLGEEAPDDDITLLAARTASVLDSEITLELPGDASGLATMRERLRRWLVAVQAGDDEIDEITMATNEAAQNAIEHGHRFAEKPLRVEFARENGSVTVIVRDEGRWQQGRSADRGRGFPLMRALMESVEVRRSPEGSAVVLRRRLGD